jgi:hypothetical protein
MVERFSFPSREVEGALRAWGRSFDRSDPVALALKWRVGKRNAFSFFFPQRWVSPVYEKSLLPEGGRELEWVFFSEGRKGAEIAVLLG